MALLLSLAAGAAVGGSLLGMMGGMNAARQQRAAAKAAAAGYRNDAKMLGVTNAYKQRLNAVQDTRALDNLRAGFRNVSSQQIAVQAKSGLSLNSKSFLMIQDEALGTFERNMRNAKVDIINRDRAADFNTKIQQASLMHKANMTEYGVKGIVNNAAMSGAASLLSTAGSAGMSYAGGSGTGGAN